MADMTLRPDDLIQHAQHETFTQQAFGLLDSGVHELSAAAEANDVKTTLQWWPGVCALNRALADRGVNRPAVAAERETRIAASLADQFGQDHLTPAVDFDDIAARTIAALPVTYEQAAGEAPRWRELTRPEMLRLRDAKTIIKSLETIAPYAEQVTRIPHWDDWRELKAQLP